jgi:hypothetical protein
MSRTGPAGRGQNPEAEKLGQAAQRIALGCHTTSGVLVVVSMERREATLPRAIVRAVETTGCPIAAIAVNRGARTRYLLRRGAGSPTGGRAGRGSFTGGFLRRGSSTGGSSSCSSGGRTGGPLPGESGGSFLGGFFPGMRFSIDSHRSSDPPSVFSPREKYLDRRLSESIRSSLPFLRGKTTIRPVARRRNVWGRSLGLPPRLAG